MTISEKDLDLGDPRGRVFAALEFVRHWKTWPIGCSESAEYQAFRAAAQCLRDNPSATKFEIAKAAANAARRQAISERKRGAV